MCQSSRTSLLAHLLSEVPLGDEIPSELYKRLLRCLCCFEAGSIDRPQCLMRGPEPAKQVLQWRMPYYIDLLYLGKEAQTGYMLYE